MGEQNCFFMIAAGLRLIKCAGSADKQGGKNGNE